LSFLQGLSSFGLMTGGASSTPLIHGRSVLEQVEEEN